jgi:hypothetical protein
MGPQCKLVNGQRFLKIYYDEIYRNLGQFDCIFREIDKNLMKNVIKTPIISLDRYDCLEIYF